MTVTAKTIEQAIGSYKDPYLGTDLITAKAVKSIVVDNGKAAVDIEVGFPIQRYGPELTGNLARVITDQCGIAAPDINLTSNIRSHAVQRGVKALPEVRNTIAVASGKGGVGKSTTAVNLALALQQEGATAGILDADIYGPSQPRMLSAHGAPNSTDGKSIEPMISYNIQAMSIGNLIEEDTPMIWRGPMATSALEQLLNDTNWTDLDYLVIDLPPGTGDIQLTLCQRIPVSGALIVTTPQDISLLDARKALRMFEKVEVPVLGIIENMSTHICTKCGHEEHIFGSGGGERMAAQYDVELLGELPLDVTIREGVDNGKPTVAMDPASPISEIYRQIARKSAAKIALRTRDYSAKFPNIVVQNT